MMKNFYIYISIFTLLFLVAVPLHAKGKEEAPGQTKKSENTSSNSDKNKKTDVVIGEVEDVTGNTVIVEEKKGKKKTEAVIDKSTKVVGQGNKPLKIGSIKLKDIVAVISTDSGELATEGGKLKVKKIFVKEASMSAQLKRRAVHGVITNILDNVLTLAHQIHRDRIYTVIVTPDTIIKFKSQVSKGSGEVTPSPRATASPEATGGAALAETTASATSLAVGQRIVVMGDLDGAGGIIAKLIHIIPGKATGIFKRLPVATPSASLLATPSTRATPSAEPTTEPSVTPSATLKPTPVPST